MHALRGGARKELVDEINAMEEKISYSWNPMRHDKISNSWVDAPQIDPYKMQFPFLSIDQLRKMIEDLDAQLKFYNRNKTPDDRWWEAQHPHESIENSWRDFYRNVTYTTRYYERPRAFAIIHSEPWGFAPRCARRSMLLLVCSVQLCAVFK